MVLEFDDAYRYRFQFAFGSINKEAFVKNPYAELSRVLNLMRDNEIDDRLKEMLRMLEKLLWMTFFSKSLRNGIVGVIGRMNPGNIMLDVADRHYAKIHHNLFVDIKNN